ncbi:hypothetical protein ACH5RR_031634 [Cinchona calisaya]|uniref:Uncharacterized protein n=1 Tax=Cinchona calisaya TaxID=153742 RepID=A0ABD2YK87_9GENT
MANCKFSASFYCILLLTVLLSADYMIPKIDAKGCHEGYPWIEMNCIGEQPDDPCVDECVKRRGPGAWAICRSFTGVPGTFCECWWHC